VLPSKIILLTLLLTTLGCANLAEVPRYSEAEIDQRIQEYFREGNQGVLSDSSMNRYERNVSQSLKEEVKERDGFKCIICGASDDLEVDHTRALMNGGGNQIENLATLCDSCHTKKTRLDNSLRRKREKLYGKAQ